MPKLDAFFDKPSQKSQHPVVFYLDEFKPDHVEVEIVRPKDVLGFKAAKLYLRLQKDGQLLPPQEYAWDDELNAELIERGVRAVSPDNEKLRCALSLRYGLKRAESRYGDGFFNSVLLVVVKEANLPDFAEVAEVLRHVQTNPPHKDGYSYLFCHDMIEQIIRERATELVERLKYPRDQAEEILAGAVARYLDERFTVTDRVRLGWA